MNATVVGENQSPGAGAILLGTILVIESVVAALGNMLVLGAIYANPSLRSATDYLLANLAVADFLHASLALPLRTVNVFHGLVIPCHVVVLFTVLCGGASNMAVLLVSLDRVVAIVQSLRYYTILTTGRVRACIVTTWLFVLGLAILPQVGWGRLGSSTPSTGTCRFTETLQREYLVLESAVLFVLPVFTVLLVYAVILKAACRHSKAIRAHEMCHQTRNAQNTAGQERSLTAVSAMSEKPQHDPRCTRSGGGTPNTKRQARALRTITILVGVFIVLVLPIIVIDVLEMWVGAVVPDCVVKVAICMIYANSGVNVFIYAKSNSEYRRTFKRLFNRLRCNAGSLFWTAGGRDSFGGDAHAVRKSTRSFVQKFGNAYQRKEIEKRISKAFYHRVHHDDSAK